MVSMKLVRLSVIAAAVAFGLGEVVSPRAAVAQTQGQQTTERWMAEEATRKVNEIFKPNSVVVIRSSLATLEVRGSLVRVIGGVSKTYHWRVIFTVVGSGSRRQLVAGTPKILG